MVQIETGIPIPAKPHKSKYPWDTMEVGQSFVGGRGLGTLASATGKRIGRKFVTRKLECGNVRVWRTE